jgi:hypothetical protein
VTRCSSQREGSSQWCLSCSHSPDRGCRGHDVVDEGRMYLRLARLARTKHLAILCGAGISHWSPANKPLGNQLRDEIVRGILSKLRDKPAIRVLTRSYSRPLEHTVSQLGWGIEFCLEKVFSDSYAKPNAWHRLLASMVKSRQLAVVFTLNFDRMIERALAELGLEEPRDYVSIITEAGAPKREGINPGRPVVYHLHGD